MSTTPPGPSPGPGAPMRVALLTSAGGWRGSGVSFGKIARGLAERGHRTHVVTAAAPVTARLEEAGLSVTEIAGGNTGLSEILALRRALRGAATDAGTGTDAIIVDTPRDLRLAAFATLGRRTRVVYRYNLNYRRLRTDLADRLYLARVAAFVFQSSYIRERAFREAPWLRRVPNFRIPNGYDLRRFRPEPAAGRAFRARLGLAAGAPVVVSASKLTRNKGHDVAIAALARLRHAGLDVAYVVCGDGGREPELRAQAAAAGLPVHFVGLLAAEELVAAFGAADLVVHPSLEEIFPNAVGEAMACARPVVAADAGGTGELVGRDGTAGLLVPPGDADMLADAAAALLADAARREAVGAAARERIATEFPLGKMIGAYEAALAEVVGCGAGRR